MNIVGKITVGQWLATAALISLCMAGFITHTLTDIKPSVFVTLLQRETGTLTLIGVYFLILALLAFLISQVRKYFFRASQ